MLHWLSETLGTLYFALLIFENWKGKKNEKNIPVWRECTEPCVAASLDWSQWSESTLPLIYPVCRRKVVFVPENRTKQILRLSVIIEPLRLVPGRYCHQFSKSWQMNLCHSLYFWPDCIFYYFITSICGDNYCKCHRALSVNNCALALIVNRKRKRSLFRETSLSLMKICDILSDNSQD